MQEYVMKNDHQQQATTRREKMDENSSGNHRFALAIHGGSGTIEKKHMHPSLYETYRLALQATLDAGLRILQQGGTAIAAVEAAVTNLENCPLFNAGRGAAFNKEGYHEMDAAIMNGQNLAAGAVAAVRGVKNPVQLARLVMENSPYVFVCGKGALSFAQEQGLPVMQEDYFYTSYRYAEWKAATAAPSARMSTVGAVALDQQGNLAAATSSGGLTGKQYSRIGDSPVIGCGTYADNDSCAISCTGDGEQFIRSVLAHDIACRMKYKQYSLAEACSEALQDRWSQMGGSGGLIALDRNGEIVMPFNTEGMYRACRTPDGHIHIAIYAD